MKVIEHVLQIWNTEVTITEENKERIYRILTNMLGTIKLLTVVTFGYLSMEVILESTLPGWFLPIELVVMFGSIIYYCIKIVRNR